MFFYVNLPSGVHWESNILSKSLSNNQKSWDMDTYKNDQEASCDPTQQTLTNTKRYPRKICERENGCLKFSDFNTLSVISVARRKILTRNINGIGSFRRARASRNPFIFIRLSSLYIARRMAFASNINRLCRFAVARLQLHIYQPSSRLAS